MIGGIDEAPAEGDDKQHDGDLEDDDDAVNEGRLFGSANEQQRSKSEMNDGRDVDDAVHAGAVTMLERRMRPLVGDTQAEPPEHAIDVLAPGDGDGGGADRVLEHQIPADDPGDELAHGGIGVGVGAAGDGNHRGEFGVAEAGESATDAGDDEGEHDRRTRAIGDGGRGADEQARADDPADTERDQVHRPERALQAVFADFLSFGHQLVERLCRE